MRRAREEANTIALLPKDNDLYLRGRYAAIHNDGSGGKISIFDVKPGKMSKVVELKATEASGILSDHYYLHIVGEQKYLVGPPCSPVPGSPSTVPNPCRPYKFVAVNVVKECTGPSAQCTVNSSLSTDHSPLYTAAEPHPEHQFTVYNFAVSSVERKYISGGVTTYADIYQPWKVTGDMPMIQTGDIGLRITYMNAAPEVGGLPLYPGQTRTFKMKLSNCTGTVAECEVDVSVTNTGQNVSVEIPIDPAKLSLADLMFLETYINADTGNILWKFKLGIVLEYQIVKKDEQGNFVKADSITSTNGSDPKEYRYLRLKSPGVVGKKIEAIVKDLNRAGTVAVPPGPMGTAPANYPYTQFRVTFERVSDDPASVDYNLYTVPNDPPLIATKLQNMDMYPTLPAGALVMYDSYKACLGSADTSNSSSPSGGGTGDGVYMETLKTQYPSIKFETDCSEITSDLLTYPPVKMSGFRIFGAVFHGL